MNYPYMPHFVDQNSRVWNVNTISLWIGSAGRSAEIECSCDDLQGIKFFVYRASTNTFIQDDPEEVVHSIPNQGEFWNSLHCMFKSFDRNLK